MKHLLIGLLLALGLVPASLLAQDRSRPYLIAYDHYLEETGALEISTVPVVGSAHDINTFLGDWIEFEYGAKKWWTTEFYLDWQHTQHDSTVFTGFRFENRFRPFLEAHRINPVLYVEYEHLNRADKTLKEIVGFDSKADLADSNNDAREQHEREIETKLILSSDIGEWNLAENIIGVKNLNEGKWEFGYALGLSRRLSERFTAGVEAYGGLGIWGKVTLRGTSQYVAPLLVWTLPSETTIRISPGWGLTDQSVGTLFRIGVSQEIDGIGHHISKIFRKH
jgi:hypothetical protein